MRLKVYSHVTLEPGRSLLFYTRRDCWPGRRARSWLPSRGVWSSCSPDTAFLMLPGGGVLVYWSGWRWSEQCWEVAGVYIFNSISCKFRWAPICKHLIPISNCFSQIISRFFSQNHVIIHSTIDDTINNLKEHNLTLGGWLLSDRSVENNQLPFMPDIA